LPAVSDYWEFKPPFEKMARPAGCFGRAGGETGHIMTRPSEVTRDRIMKAAERLFAEKGYDGTSIRVIVAKARVNQAAINYHFGGKDGLYREVLRVAFRGMTQDQLAHAEDVKTLSREEALTAFIRRQLRPLMARDESSRHMRIFNWETVRPTPVLRSLVAEEAAPFMNMAAEIAGRFLPNADRKTLTVASIWLIGQCSVFLRNRDRLAEPPIELNIDDAMVEWLGGMISRWIVAGFGSATSH
jgi:AcrR family transcriptional regulator